MNIFNKLKEDIILSIKSLNEQLVTTDVVVELPKDRFNGDLSTNAAMVLARAANMSPKELALLIKDKLIKSTNYISHIEIAGPGFINFTIKPQRWYEEIISIISLGKDYGNNNIGEGRKVNLEYVSANPTGPMHIGHARGAVFGDVLAKILEKSGYNVTKEFYINDAGAQINVLLDSLFLRYKQAITGEDIEIPKGLYPGEYLINLAQEVKKDFKDDLLNKEDYRNILKPKALEYIMSIIKEDLLALGVKHDVFFSEQSLHDSGMISSVISDLQSKDLVFYGKIEAPKGHLDEDWSEREQLLFKSENYGDDQNRALQKKDGSWTYFAADIAYAADKVKRGFDQIIMVLGADHAGYIKRINAIIEAVSAGKVKSEVKICQLVNFVEQGVPVKMSKRAGTFTTVRDVLSEVGADIIRFMMLTRRNDMMLDFDLEKVKEASKDNPVFYVQYAYVRANSIINNIKSLCPEAYEDFTNSSYDLSLLDTEEDINLIKNLSSWPKVVESAAKYFEPHRIAFYLQNIASEFHSIWNLGKDQIEYKFVIQDNQKLTAAKLCLAFAVKEVIASGLDVLSIQPLEKM